VPRQTLNNAKTEDQTTPWYGK